MHHIDDIRLKANDFDYEFPTNQLKESDHQAITVRFIIASSVNETIYDFVVSEKLFKSSICARRYCWTGALPKSAVFAKL